MGLIGSTNAERIWNFMKSKGMNDFGVAGLMGNLYAESGLNPCNLQNTGNRTLGLSDDEYTAAVDNGTYSNFVRDSQGYGLAQWTWWSRKEHLLDFAKAQNASVGNLEMQLAFLMKELNESYPSVLRVLKNASSVFEASNAVLLKFERPADQGETVQNKRAEYGLKYFDQFAKSVSTEMTAEEFAELFMMLRNGLRDNDCQDYSLAARNWAITIGLVVGGGTLENGEPNYMWQDFITREQMITVLHRFAQI